jgi:hypothetical protein
MPMMANQSEMDEIARAEAEVAREKAELARSLRAVGRSSEKMALRIGGELKPALGAAIVVAGAAVAVGVTVALVRRGRRRDGWLSPQPPSALSTAAKTVGLWALRLLARRVAQEVVSRLAAPGESATAPLGATAAPTPRY